MIERKMSTAERAAEVLSELGVPAAWPAVWHGHEPSLGTGPMASARSPIDGEILGEYPTASVGELQQVLAGAEQAFLAWRQVPAPRRGEFVRRIGQRLRKYQEPLAELVTCEAGKIVSEARGEVQEMIDICDFAVGLSRQLYGRTMPSERPAHRLTEQWHPLGPVGVISAFNFPGAVWAWNAMIALVCGDSVVWKPSEKTPLTALACHALAVEAAHGMDDVPPGVVSVVLGEAEIGRALAASPSLPLISATGGTAMGRQVAQTVAGRLGRTLLELGGNNAAIVAPSADLDLTTRAILFAAVGTCGQRCTTLRRLIVHASVADQLLGRLRQLWTRLPIGDPRLPGTLVGPLIDRRAREAMQSALAAARAQGGRVWGGEPVTEGVPSGGCYVQPAIVEIDPAADVVQRETFAPILYVWPYEDWDQAVAWQNGVAQGLASSVFTRDVKEAERFCGPAGSDCGIANVNIGPSGAEIGGAFGGEKETGGGRESGSDSWKAYMRRATNTINYSDQLPLAQGIRFEL